MPPHRRGKLPASAPSKITKQCAQIQSQQDSRNSATFLLAHGEENHRRGRYEPVERLRRNRRLRRILRPLRKPILLRKSSRNDRKRRYDNSGENQADRERKLLSVLHLD